MGKGWQVVLAKEGRIHEGIRCTRVNQRLDRDGRLAGHKKVDQQGKMTGDGVGERSRCRKNASQPGPYWLGCPFFGREEMSKVVWGEGGKGMGVQGPGNGPWKAW